MKHLFKHKFEFHISNEEERVSQRQFFSIVSSINRFKEPTILLNPYHELHHDCWMVYFYNLETYNKLLEDMAIYKVKCTIKFNYEPFK